MATSLTSAQTTASFPAHLVINILSERQARSALYFFRADLYPEPFAALPHTLTEEGLPVLDGSVGTMSCRLVAASWPLHDLQTLVGCHRNVRPCATPGFQFITGPCTGDVDCASGCCGFNTGKCAGAIIAQECNGGCGFGAGKPNDNAACKLRGEAPANTGVSAPTTPVPATALGTQFITRPCKSDADCASGCCSFKSGKCAGAITSLHPT